MTWMIKISSSVRSYAICSFQVHDVTPGSSVQSFDTNEHVSQWAGPMGPTFCCQICNVYKQHMNLFFMHLISYKMCFSKIWLTSTGIHVMQGFTHGHTSPSHPRNVIGWFFIQVLAWNQTPLSKSEPTWVPTKPPSLTLISKQSALCFTLRAVCQFVVHWALLLTGVSSSQFPCCQALAKRTGLKTRLASWFLAWHHVANCLSHVWHTWVERLQETFSHQGVLNSLLTLISLLYYHKIWNSCQEFHWGCIYF